MELKRGGESEDPAEIPIFHRNYSWKKLQEADEGGPVFLHSPT